MDINTCFATVGDLRDLALYANFVPAITSIILAIFVLYKANNKRKAIVFAGFIAVFALWLISSGIIWVSDNYYLVAAFWSPIDYFKILFYLLLFGFFFLDTFDSTPWWISVIIALTASVSFIINITGNGVFGFDQSWCNMNNNDFLTKYNLVTEIIILASILGLGIYKFIKAKGDRKERIRLSIVTGSIVLFMGVFSGSEYWSSVTDVYTTELYALFLLPIFILFLTVSITSYGTFRLGDTVAKVLFYIFIVFSGAQFFFTTSMASFVLTVIAFLITIGFGILLLRSYEKVDLLAKELQDTNDRQETLIHFIGHEVKGFLTKDAGAFAAISQGDFGVPPDGMKPFVDSALIESRQGADSVSNILKASNLKKGTVTYEKAPFDLKALVAEAVEKARVLAERKGLALSFTADDASHQTIGDKAQISEHVLRNIIDNSINYTPSGSVAVSLKNEGGKLIFAVKDTGIGIDEEDRKHLFTEGGHGKDSQKTNVHSTGYGLYIAKKITEAHGGTIRMESTGKGQGSTCTVELPAN